MELIRREAYTCREKSLLGKGLSRLRGFSGWGLIGGGLLGGASVDSEIIRRGLLGRELKKMGDYWEGSFLETGLLGGVSVHLMGEFRRGLIKRGTHKEGAH